MIFGFLAPLMSAATAFMGQNSQQDAAELQAKTAHQNQKLSSATSLANQQTANLVQANQGQQEATRANVQLQQQALDQIVQGFRNTLLRNIQ